MSPEHYESKLEQFNIPGYMIDGILDYIIRGKKPGHFLSAVIRNDLMGAIAHADGTNIDLIKEYVGFFYSYAPMECYGSEERFKNWKGLGTRVETK